MPEPIKGVVYRILKGTNVSHFHPACPSWPAKDFYEQETPLWWGAVCASCQKLADEAKQGNLR